jgi:hypothetical protein
MKRTTSQRPLKKHLVMVTGDKGGTGKTTFARGLLDIYQHLNIPCQAYDSDRRNAQLYRHYHETITGVAEIDITTKGEADELLNNLEVNPSPAVLVDMPAGSGEWFETLERDLNLIDVTAELGYRLTLVSVMSRVKDSINALRVLMDYAGDRVDYVAVKNLYFGDENQYARFTSSKTHEQFITLGGIEITMPSLFDVSYDLVDEQDLTFRAAAQVGSSLTLAHRSRINQWLRTIEAETRKAKDYLGISG